MNRQRGRVRSVEEARVEVTSEGGCLSDEGKSVADQLGDAVRVRNAGNCGCAPCWGPPAPPAMRAELFEGLS